MDFSKFKAAMFDFDGTVTEKGVYKPSQEVADILVELAHKMPIAFCTGRQLESFERHGFEALIAEIKPSELHSFFENLYLFAENGAVGYSFNTDLDEFEEFYKVAWPDSFKGRDEFCDEINEAVKDYGEVYFDAHRVIVVIRTKLTYVPIEERDINEVYALSGKIYEIVLDMLRQIDPSYEDFVHIGNAGIGVVVCPANGDKDNGIKQFGNILTKNRDFSFENKEYREIIVVGDQAQAGGNDYYFLKGDYGTPFSVGSLVEGHQFPLPVFDKNKKRLFHSKGTLRLIKSILQNSY